MARAMRAAGEWNPNAILVMTRILGRFRPGLRRGGLALDRSGGAVRLAWELLRPGGHLAFWSALHVYPAGGDPFLRDIQNVYAEIGEGLPPSASWPQPGELPDERAEIEGSGLFEDVTVVHFDWEIRYSAAQYIRLLDTFSGHIAMAEWQRDRLYSAIRDRLAQRSDGRLRRHWGAALHVARRRDIAAPPGL